MVVRSGAAAVAVVLLAGQQQPPQVFRTGVSTVAVYASVTDSSGQPIRDLKREDFQLFDDKQRQELTVFNNGLQPITAVLLVDTSASMAVTLDLARHAAEQFVIRMLPEDRARVGSFSDRTDLSREFTGDRDSLLRALRDDLHIGNPTKLWDAVGTTMEALASMPGRRVVLLFTDGEDTASEHTGRKIIERARLDEVMIYAVQIRSRAKPGVELMMIGPNNIRQPQRGDPTPTQVLRSLSSETGGAHFLLGRFDDVNATFTQIALELHHQYLLGFTPQRRDGKIHQIEVKTANSRVQVRARRYYMAPSGSQ